MSVRFRPPESYLENTKQTFILVDYSNLLYRAWFVSSKRANVAYSKFFDMLRLCVKRSKQKDVPLKVIFAGESVTELDRKKIFPDYKGTRGTIEDPKFKKFKEGLPELLRFVGWEVISVDGAEADDIIATIVANYCYREDSVNSNLLIDKDPGNTDIVIFSGDRDLQQCLAWERTFIYRAPGLFVTKASYEEDQGIPVSKYHIYKALTGDKSDNIKGVEGFGPVKAVLAIKSHSVAESIWEMRGEEGRKEFDLALKLVNLDCKLDVDLDSLYLGPPIFDDATFMKSYDYKILLELQRLKEEF